jgi:hypothetical protein
LRGNSFEGFSQAELLAYTFRTHGERGLREVLTRIRADKESLVDHSDELELIGMVTAADIIREYVDEATSRYDQSRCPYPSFAKESPGREAGAS